MSLTPAARRWSALIDEYETSGLGQRTFAKQRGINPSTLAAWRSKLGRSSVSQPAATHFTELVVAEEAPAAPVGDVILHLREGAAELVISRNTDLALLRRVVDALC